MPPTTRPLDRAAVLEKIPSRTLGLVRVAAALPGFYRDRISVERAENEIKTRARRPRGDVSRFHRARVYGRAASPYLNS
jgi:HSP20 family molecular chaperone IbpA